MQKLVLPIILLFLIGIACSDIQDLTDFDKLDNNPEFALPLINSTFTLQDVLENVDDNASVLVDSDGLLRFYYESDTTTRTSLEVFDVINSTLPPLVPVIDSLIGFRVVNTAGIGVDLVIFKEGRLEYSFLNPHQSELDVKVSLLQMFKDGEPLVQEHTIGPLQALPLSQFDLAGVALDPQNDSLFVRYEAYNEANERVKVNNFLLLQKDVQYSYASGVLESTILENTNDTLAFDIYDNVSGSVYFEDPKVVINIGNSFGLPANIKVSRFDFLTKEGDILPLESEYIDNGFAFNFPDFDEIGETKETQFIFDNSNSNLSDVIAAQPVGLIYELDAITNPNQDTRGFLTDSSAFSYSVEADFPLYASIRALEVKDTSDFDINIDNIDNIEALEFKLITENNVPLSAAVQAYFASGNQVLDSLFVSEKQNIIEAASVDVNGNVTATNSQTIFIPFDKNRIQNLDKANKIYLHAVFNTEQNNDTSVRIENGQELNVRVGVKIKY